MKPHRFVAPTTELTVLYKMSAGEELYQLSVSLGEPLETSGVDFEKNQTFIGEAVARFVAKAVRQASDFYANADVCRDFSFPLTVQNDHVKGYRILAIFGGRPKALVNRWDNPITL